MHDNAADDKRPLNGNPTLLDMPSPPLHYSAYRNDEPPFGHPKAAHFLFCARQGGCTHRLFLIYLQPIRASQYTKSYFTVRNYDPSVVAQIAAIPHPRGETAARFPIFIHPDIWLLARW
ncbi:hypothetical protein [Sphingobium fuliginis]|uniref:hypothetical protein n=1 Tax=Sphingobium fuliginis (strain ATCC 27551) TaxID=336203 RepID=UPI0013044E33|nr:hypothetical protein [Sphingobium fuliginis]